MVSEIEERHAARFDGYTWRDWHALNRQERVDSVAAYRLDRLVDIHSQDAVARDADRRRRAATRHRGGGAR